MNTDPGTIMHLNLTLSKPTILDSSKQKEFADANSKFDENSGNFSEKDENTEGKGENAIYEQFLLFPVFQNTWAYNKFAFLAFQKVEKIVRKGENVAHQLCQLSNNIF